MLLPFKARFSADAVRAQLQLLFGDRLLGDDSLRTALCVVAKRADTNSVWPILNHPEGKYYPRNSLMPLRDVIRASTAAPTYFIAETLDVGGQSGAFIDGGVSMANNPALTMFLVATLKGFPFHWKTGEDQLLLVSLGTGQWRQQKLPQAVSDANIIASAAAVPEMLMQDANWHNQMLLQALSRSPTAAIIDREIGDLSGDLLTPEPLMNYLRYNATLESEALRELGLPQLSSRAEALHDMSDADNRHELLDSGPGGGQEATAEPPFPGGLRPAAARMKSCFVIQGYGRKTDYRDGRVLDLDASYAIIKDAVEAAGLECIRADEIQHSGTIDLPMYEWLLKADLVVADLSTYNVNAVFELGVRYALRPHATIIVAEELFQNPFDFSHIAIRRYKHLGDDIGAKEARRFRDELKAAIAAIAAERRIDSPIYTFLPNLRPPLDQKAVDEEALAPFAPLPTAAPPNTCRRLPTCWPRTPAPTPRRWT